MQRLILCLLFLSCSVNGYASISPSTYNALTELQQQISEQPSDQKASEIERDLIKLANDLKGNSLGLALTYQTHAQLKSYQQSEAQAQTLLLKAIELPELKDDTLNQLRSVLAYSFFNESQYSKAIEQLKVIIGNSKSTSANTYALLAAAYYSLDDFENGLPYIVKACELSESPKEGWLQMAFSGYYRNKNYTNALNYVNLLVYYFPDKKDYWQQKAGLHQIMENYPKAAITKELAYKKGFITKESDFVNLTQLLAAQGEAFKVANALELAIKSKLIEPNERVLTLLFQAWLQAKEIDSAKFILAELFNAYKQVDDGYSLLQYYIDGEQWKLADSLAEKLYSLELNDKQKGKVYLYQGMVKYRLGDERAALKLLGKSTAFENSSSQAKSWMSYIKQMGA